MVSCDGSRSAGTSRSGPTQATCFASCVRCSIRAVDLQRGGAPMANDVVISADSHMTEPPDLWVQRIDKSFRDRAPRAVHEAQGKPGYWFVCEGLEPRSVAGTLPARQ